MKILGPGGVVTGRTYSQNFFEGVPPPLGLFRFEKEFSLRTLVLDNTYFPVKIIGWQQAMILLFSGRAEVVIEYDDKQIQSTRQSFKLPKILKLLNRHKGERQIKFTRANVFWRDNFQCQYCFLKLPGHKLTLDHVIPVSKAGPHNWENVVTCCPRCNVKKGSKSLKEMGMKLKNPPTRPKWCPQLYLRLKADDPKEWWQWIAA